MLRLTSQGPPLPKVTHVAVNLRKESPIVDSRPKVLITSVYLISFYIHRYLCENRYKFVSSFQMSCTASTFMQLPFRKGGNGKESLLSFSAEVGPLNQKSILCEKYAHIVAVSAHWSFCWIPNYHSLGQNQSFSALDLFQLLLGAK